MMMKEKNIIYIDRENITGHTLAAKRDFLVGSNLTMTGVWRSKMDGESMVDDFYF